MVGRTTWLCANYSFKMVYQCMPATNGNIHKDSEAIKYFNRGIN